MNIDRIPPDIHFNENGEIVWTPRLIDFNARAYTRGHTVTADEFNTELIKQTYQGNYNTDTINVLTKLYGTVNRNSVVALEKATTAESASKQALEDVTKVLDNVADITERAETAVERAEEALATIDGFATDEDISNALKDYYTNTEVDNLIKNVEVDLSDYYTRTETDTAISTLNSSISQLDSTKLDKSEVVSLPIGSIFASAIPQSDARVHLLDGSTISQTGVYKTFSNLIKALVSAGNNIAYEDDEELTAEQKFNADVTATGNCGKFVIDDTAGTIRLPKITTFIQGLSNIADIGKSLEAGLPNITGDFKTRTNVVKETTGLFNLSSESVTGDWSQANLTTAGYNLDKIDFNASNSNSIYGNSSTVQPSATMFPYYIVLASGYKSSQVIDIDNVMNDVNHISNEINRISGEVEGKLPLSGGTLTGDLTLGSNVKIRMNTGAAIVHYDSSIGCPTFGVSSLPTLIHGSTTRPYYRLTNNPLALLSDIPHLYQHCIQCVGSNCNFTINLVNTHSTPGVGSVDSLMNYMQSYYNKQWVAANGKYFLNSTYSTEHMIMIKFQPGSFTFVGAPTGGNGGHSATIDVATMRNTISAISTYTVQIM